MRPTAYCGFCELEIDAENDSRDALEIVALVLREHMMVVHGWPEDLATQLTAEWWLPSGVETAH